MASAAETLRSEDSTALGLLAAADQLLTKDFHTWEPESIWLALDAKGIDLSIVNRNKLQAALTLLFNSGFYHDAIIFEKTALAFNNQPINSEILQEASSAYLSWAVYEAHKILEHEGLPSYDFSQEPKVYTATVLYREGLVLAPAPLAFAQEELDRLTANTDLKKQVEEAANSDISDLFNHKFEETELGVQLARLAATAHYLVDKKKQLETEVSPSSSPPRPAS